MKARYILYMYVSIFISTYTYAMASSSTDFETSASVRKSTRDSVKSPKNRGSSNKTSEPISTPPSPPIPPPTSSYGNIFKPLPVTTFNGNKIAVWVDNHSIVQLSTLNSGASSWSPPTQISNSSAIAQKPQITITPEGNFLVTWTNVANTPTIEYRYYSASTQQWGDISIVPQPTFSKVLKQTSIVDSQNNTFTVFVLSQFNPLAACAKHQQISLSTVQFDRNGSNCNFLGNFTIGDWSGDLQLFYDSDENAWLTWQQKNHADQTLTYTYIMANGSNTWTLNSVVPSNKN